MQHYNPYIIILVLFAVTGLITTIWGWSIIAKAKKTKRWPSVEGLIEKSGNASDQNDLLPEIIFSYSVNGKTYRQVQAFSTGLTPGKEFTKTYIEKYPAGLSIKVYYDPADPERATLEPGFISGDWMVFALGIGMLLSGILFLFFSG